jgi:hypothetical protein
MRDNSGLDAPPIYRWLGPAHDTRSERASRSHRSDAGFGIRDKGGNSWEKAP